ncbi:DUF3471 domain-containing protein [Pontibacter toksunensis]|uniref:DUF3471 domain-containing protein n=1 Tax=Pontibacter toksunensis TaxID=1332631 RepID=A0ABW6BWU4_9BACT
MKKLIFIILLSPVTLFANPKPDVNQAKPTYSTALAEAEEALARYVGVYKMNEQFSITISLEGGKLYALAQGDAEKTEFTPVSGNKFLVKGPETEVEFLEEDGKVQYLFVNMQGGLKLKKVN